MLIGYARVSKADGSQSLDLQRDALVTAGVADYSFERLLADYEEALLLLLHRMSGLDQLEFGEDRGVALMDTWFERFDARLQRVPL